MYFEHYHMMLIIDGS